MAVYTEAKYVPDEFGGDPEVIAVLIDGKKSWVHIHDKSPHYVEMMALVDAGELSIAPAESI